MPPRADLADQDSDAKLVDPELADRLRKAVKRAGSIREVSRRTGIPERSLQTYLSGRDLKRLTLVAIADACGVSIEWLAAGRGTMGPGNPALSSPAAPARPVKLFSSVDMDLLGGAMDTALQMLPGGAPPPRGRALAQIVCILYDEAKARIEEEGGSR